MAASSADTGPQQDRCRNPPSDWTINTALAWINAKANFERTPDRNEAARALKLERMRALAAALGDPQLGVPALHVAGSKGKGSITRMAASILNAAGLQTGAFTSPHLISPNERIAVDRTPIADHDLARALWRVAQAEDKIPADVRQRFGVPTYFEAMTAAAFEHLAQAQCDAAVYEVGLGGRLDSTNILTPKACVLASIELEHTEILGDTLERIAAEKAGILKPGVPAIATPQTPEVLGVFRERADAIGAPLTVLGQDAPFAHKMDGGHAFVDLTIASHVFTDLRCPFPGIHQAANTAAAVAGCALLLGDRLTTDAVHAGLAATPRDGRMEVIAKEPTIIVDGAHTPTSIRATLDALPPHDGPMVIVFGCARDKNAAAMLKTIEAVDGHVVFTEAGPRATPAAALRDAYAVPAQANSNTEEALTLARKHAGRAGLILVLGSFMLAGEVKRLAATR